MADDNNIPVITSLGEEDFRGVDPAQMLQLAANERANNAFNLSVVNSIQNQRQDAARLAFDQAKFNREIKFKKFQEQFKQSKDLAAASLAQKKFDLNSAYTKALTEQSVTTQKKMKTELDNITQREERMQSYSGTKLKINGSDQEFDILDLMYMKQSGVPITFKPDSKVSDLIQDEKSGEVHAVMNDGTVQTIPELQNLTLKSLKQPVTNIKLDPGQRAEAVRRGTIRASFTDPDYINSVRDRVDTADVDYYGQSISTDPEQVRLADQKVIDEVIKDITGTTEDPITYIPGKGFFTLRTDKEGNVVRGSDNLPVTKRKVAAPIR